VRVFSRFSYALYACEVKDADNVLSIAYANSLLQLTTASWPVRDLAIREQANSRVQSVTHCTSGLHTGRWRERPLGLPQRSRTKALISIAKVRYCCFWTDAVLTGEIRGLAAISVLLSVARG